jgi:signal transduction histidine kinase
VSLLGGMARILALTLAMFRTIEGERVLLEQSELQREENAALLHTLAEQNEQLRQLDRMKDEFLGLVSHELRTPLTSIQGYLEMLIDDHLEEFSDEQRAFLATIDRNTERLIRLVSDLLFLFQLDTHPLEIQEAEIEVAELLEHAAAAMKPIADQKHVSLAVDADELCPVMGDRARLAQLVDNLVSNAVKFTPDGGHVTIHGKHLDGGVAVSVSDTGIGIPADEIPLLFKRFFRATNATANAVPGTGLGLAISQSIAHAHGTEIEVSSTPGEGTTFRLLLPAARPLPER